MLVKKSVGMKSLSLMLRYSLSQVVALSMNQGIICSILRYKYFGIYGNIPLIYFLNHRFYVNVVRD